MTDNVKPIVQVKSQPQAGVVQQLEFMLEKAKAGQIYNVLVIGEDREGGIAYARSIDTRSTIRFIGSLEVVKHQLINSKISDNGEPT